MTEYIWRVKTRLPERYMTLCKVLVRGKMNTCLVEFEDGYRVTTSRNYVMRQETWQKRQANQSLKNLDASEDI
ncbi:MAG TPA: hypothetical protein VFQ13_15040 [Anaerolineales bacterium]|nr:hypothetical protein [Anaerolineales bacterium]